MATEIDMPTASVPTFPNRRKLKIEDRELLQTHLDRLPPETSDQNFTSLFIWRHTYDTQISRLNGSFCLSSGNPDESCILTPVGQEAVQEVAETYLAHLNEEGRKPYIARVSESAVNRHFTDRARFSVSEDRESFDYVYTAEHLVGLSGRSYHGQRNHIRRFKRQYPDYTLERIGPENTAECSELVQKWCVDKLRILRERPNVSPEVLARRQVFMNNETCAVRELFAHFADLSVTGLAIRVDGRIRAFAVGEPLNEDTALIHLEKADRDYHGLAQFISQVFCEFAWAGHYQFINREEDLGFVGLRTAKLALGPHHLVRKYTVRWTPRPHHRPCS
jgi:hypothetical protein